MNSGFNLITLISIGFSDCLILKKITWKRYVPTEGVFSILWLSTLCSWGFYLFTLHSFVIFILFTCLLNSIFFLVVFCTAKKREVLSILSSWLYEIFFEYTCHSERITVIHFGFFLAIILNVYALVALLY